MANWAAGMEAAGKGLGLIAQSVGQREEQQALWDRQNNLEELRNRREIEKEGRDIKRSDQVRTEDRAYNDKVRADENARREKERKEDADRRASELKDNRSWQRTVLNDQDKRQTRRDIQAARYQMNAALQKYDDQINDALKAQTKADGTMFNLATLDQEAATNPEAKPLQARIAEIRMEKDRFLKDATANLVSLGDTSIPGLDDSQVPTPAAAPAKDTPPGSKPLVRKPAPLIGSGDAPTPAQQPSGFDAVDQTAATTASEREARDKRAELRDRAEQTRSSNIEAKVRAMSDAELQRYIISGLPTEERAAVENEQHRRANPRNKKK